MARKVITLDSQNELVKFPEFDSNDPLVYQLFNNLGKEERQTTFEAMLHIGALAMMSDRISHLIDATEKQIFPQLERFKLQFERRKAEFEDTAQKKGDLAEGDIVDILNEYATKNKWSDHIVKSGLTKGQLESAKGDPNKTGDVLATVEFTPKDGGSTELTTVGIEVKFEKNFPFGDPEKFNVDTGKPMDKGFAASDKKTVWSQLLETKANRDSPFSIIVLDKQLPSSSISKNVSDVAYLPGVPGFVVIIDSQSGDYTNLLLTYKIARDMAVHHTRDNLDVNPGIIEMIVKRILHYVGDVRDISDKIKSHVETTIKMNTDVQKLLEHAVLHAEFTEAFLQRYLSTKTLTDVDFAEFYFAHPVAEQLRKKNADETKFAKELKEKL